MGVKRGLMKIGLIACCLITAGCSTSQFNAKEIEKYSVVSSKNIFVNNTKPANVFIYKETGGVFSFCSNYLYIDDQLVAKINPKQRLELYLQPNQEYSFKTYDLGPCPDAGEFRKKIKIKNQASTNLVIYGEKGNVAIKKIN